jgi:hypothetical protein
MSHYIYRRYQYMNLLESELENYQRVILNGHVNLAIKIYLRLLPLIL